MNLQKAQIAFFQLYHNPGYRLAHRLNPTAFVEVMGLSGEAAELVAGLDATQLTDFAQSLSGKRRVLFEAASPTAYPWVLEHHPSLIRDFLELYGARPFGEQESPMRNFVSFLRECSLFYDDIPRAVADVAEFELMVHATKQQQATLPADRQRSCSSHCSWDSEFSWDSLYWKPARTSVAGFTVDPLSIYLKKSDMDQPATPTSVVMAPSFSETHPTVLRVAPTAASVISLMEEPMSAQQVLARCQEKEVRVAPTTLQALLTKFTGYDVIDHYCVASHHA